MQSLIDKRVGIIVTMVSNVHMNDKIVVAKCSLFKIAK